ncbi:MAG: L,D-transpeptidase family protein, partial [Clostridiales bacterium]|nr:L,D-transpeptidase family protein [Clostridiales bacterium]
MENNKRNRLTAMIAALVIIVAIIVGLLIFVAVRLTLATNRGKTFYEGTTVNSVDVSGLTAQEAEAKLSALAEEYVLTVQFADSEQAVTGEAISLAVSSDNHLQKLVRTQNKTDAAELSAADLELTDETLFTCDETALAAVVSAWDELDALSAVTPVDAKLVYSETMGKFTVEEETVGGTVDADELTAAIVQQASTLAETLDVVESGLYGTEIRTAEGEEMQQALEDANTKLNLSIVYTYSVESADIYGTEEIGYDLLSQWLYVEDDGITIAVNGDKLQSYVSQMYETYSVHDNATSQFVTSTGDFVEVSVPASDETVDTDALYNDIIDCVDTMTDGQRDAPYASTSVGIEGTTDLGGSYVEVDLDSQHLWLYKDGELIAEGDICSGDVATGCSTPTGLYTIDSMETDRWLNGEDYHDWVSYWMPFNGGIGLHDATWRSEDEFGGDVYLESGSHGCINMPLDLAQQVYENVEVGTYVILYGGVASTVEQAQTITGTSSYTKTVGDGSFYLDAQSTGDGALDYASSNTNVVTVDTNGKVTIVGAGTATIKVTALATDTYTQATKNITITVKSASSSSSNSSSSGSSGSGSSSSSDSSNSGSSSSGTSSSSSTG